MDVAIVGSLMALGVTFLIIAVLALRSPLIFKIALRNFLKRKRSTTMAIFGLAVGAAIITGSLAVGDSLENAVVQSTYQNLGNVDEAVRSVSAFDQSIVDEIMSGSLAGEVDAVAPLIVLPVSVMNLNSSGRESHVNIIGFTEEFLDFGDFSLRDGSPFQGLLGPNQALVNEKLASRIDASPRDTLRLSLRTPEFSFETVYSPLTSLREWDVEILDIVGDFGLGRFQLSSSGVVPENIFVRLEDSQNTLGMNGKVNTVVVSNKGDAHEGLERSQTVTPMLEKLFDERFGYEDIGFVVVPDGYVKIERKEIFFEERYLDLVTNITSTSPMVEEISPLTSYFVNWIGNETLWVAYSVVTGFDVAVDSAFGLFERNTTGEQMMGEIDDNEMIITDYVAWRLGIGEGATITLNFSVYDESFDEVFVHEDFTVKYVINLTGKADDSELMPPFPGIKGKSGCGDWDPPIPIDFGIMEGDVQYDDLWYWVNYAGTPKAYITLNKAKELWANDLGEITTIKIKPSVGTNTATLANWIGNELNGSIGYRDAGITISQIKKEGIESAEGTQIVTETFIAFGSVVVIAGMLLIVLFVATSAEERKKEIGVIRTLGATRKKTTLSFAFEGSLLSIIASAVGVVLGIVVAIICVWLTNTFWTNIVEGNEIALHLTASSIILGLVSGFLIALITYAIASYSISRMRIVEALRRMSLKISRRSRGILPILFIVFGALLISVGFTEDIDPSVLGLSWLIGPVLILLGLGFLIRARTGRRLGCGIAGLVSIVYTLAFDIVFLSTFNEPAFLLFFLSGFMVVLAATVALWSSMDAVARLFSRTSVTKVAFTNPSRKAGQSAMTMAMFAVVVFTLVALAVNISGQEANMDRAVLEQGAGYQVVAEATTPLRFDLGDEQARTENGIPGYPGGFVVAQFSTYGASGGTCSNLNSVLPPRLIGANETFLQDNTLRFSSSRYHGSSDSEGAWSELYDVQTDGSIPIIGDANTIIWIYGKNVGDTIEVTNENGESRKLLVTGILRSSIFSGSVFLSEDNLDDLYPTKAEYDFFLFKASDPDQLVPYLEQNLTAYGVDAVLVEERVRENLEIEWSYMSLFQVLLLFGLVVGTAGLALTSAKSISERRNEIGILRSLGFKRNMVLRTFLLENLYISLSGTLIGVVFGLLVSFIFFGPIGGQGYGVVIPWLTIGIIIVAVLVATILSTAGPSIRAGRMETVEALRIEE